MPRHALARLGCITIRAAVVEPIFSFRVPAVHLLNVIFRPYHTAWAGVVVVGAYYLVLTIVLWWRAKPGVIVTEYGPPKGITPAVAACLMQGGRLERSFATGLVSLATKGKIQIQQEKDVYILRKIDGSDSGLSPEERSILAAVFCESDAYAFNATDCDLLCNAYRQFKNVVDGITDPDLISSHLFLWIIGIACSVYVLVEWFFVNPTLLAGLSAWYVIYIGVWTALGASCLISAIYIWPDAIRKVCSWFVPSRRRRRLTLNDAVPVFLTATAAGGFALLGAATSSQFAALIATLVAIIAAARWAMEAPTAKGRTLIEQLRGFREFLLRADADRLMRQNAPGADPKVLEHYSAYAVAFDIDRSWGHDFASGVTELLDYERGLDPWPDLGIDKGERILLNLRPKK